MQDKFTGKSRGFAFVTMGSEADAQKAITDFNGKTVEGRPLTVNEARPREARPGGGGGGGGGRGYGGGGGGGYGGWRWWLWRRWWWRRTPRRRPTARTLSAVTKENFRKRLGQPRRFFDGLRAGSERRQEVNPSQVGLGKTSSCVERVLCRLRAFLLPNGGLTFPEKLVGKNAQAINRCRLHPQDDGTQGEGSAAVRARKCDLSRGEIAFRSDQHEDARRPRPVVGLGVVGQDIFQMPRARLERADEPQVEV